MRAHPCLPQLVPLKRATSVTTGLAPLIFAPQKDLPVPVFGANGIIGSTTLANTDVPVFIIGRVGSAGAITHARPPAWITDNALIVSPLPGAKPRFVGYALQALQLGSLISNTAQPLITQSAVKEARFPLMSLRCQTIIADFLDRETERIDALIDKKRRLIDLLEEKRTATITQAVTKGLDPTAPMKDSGIPWIGDVPRHWRLGRLKHVTVDVQTGPFGSQVHNSDYVTNGIPLINPANIVNDTIVEDSEVSVTEFKANELAQHRLLADDVVLGRRGEMGRCALVTDREAGWLCGTGSMRLRVDPDADATYLTNLIRSAPMKEYFDLYSVGSTMDNLSATTVAEAPLALPPSKEQTDIAVQIERVVAGVIETTNCLVAQITLLAEYREALITAAVTGEIDVDTYSTTRSPDLEESHAR